MSVKVGDRVEVVHNLPSDMYPLHLHDLGEIGTVVRVLRGGGPVVDVKFSDTVVDAFFPEELEVIA